MPDPDPAKLSPKSASSGETAGSLARSTALQPPGIYIQPTAPTLPTIAAISTGVAAFVGPAATGPVGKASTPLTSMQDFEAIYGGPSKTTVDGASSPVRDDLAYAVQAYFHNGGQKLYISRVSAANGGAPAADDYAKALATLEGIDEISTVAAPGGNIAGASGNASVAPIHAALIAHVSRPGSYRFAVLDPPPNCSIGDIKALRAQLDSSYAALYYPWVTIADPLSPAKAAAKINVPPSGFLCGIYARVDASSGASKAPANEALTGSLGLEQTLNAADSDTLNSLGINGLRSFPGRGNLVWGARTVSSDPQWKYVNLRRYFNYLEHSIDQGTQWAVFEPNGQSLWIRVQQTISNFLYNEWRDGALLGTRAEDAYFVRCDRTTMTQTDIDNGQLICLVGVAMLQPAEFVIFRINQQTANSPHT